MIIYTIKWCDTLKEKERIKAAKILYTSGFISLILGTVNALISLEKESYEITKTIGAFLLCYFAIASFFGNITFLDQPENEKNLKQMVEISTKKMTKSELEDQMQYWYSKYCNCVLRDERELYIKLYTALKDIYDLWLKESRFPE